MSVYEVPPSSWPAFCEWFTRQHRGDIMRIERVQEQEGREQHDTLAHAVPLGDLLLVHDDGVDELVVHTTEAAPAESTWVVRDPTGIRFEQHGETARGVLRIDAAVEPTLILRFAKPLVPGYLDGLPT